MSDLRSLQTAFNRSSRDQWDSFEGHRARVTDLLGGAAGSPPGRLCVLGAGNLNDLDVKALLNVYQEVWLVDLDAEALARGMERQGLADGSRLNRLGGVDLTGALDLMAGWGPGSRIADADLRALESWPASRVAGALPGPFETVASTCLLSQLIGNGRNSVGERHPKFKNVVNSLRLGHVRLLAELTATEGQALLVTDATSSDLEPDIISRPNVEPSTLLSRAVREGRIFHGAAPEAVLDAFRQDPMIAPRLADLRTVPPWRWRLHDRTYLAWCAHARFGKASALSNRSVIL